MPACNSGKELYITDTLSRAYLPTVPTGLVKLDVQQVEEEHFFRAVQHINMAEYLPITSERLTEIQQKTQEDESLQILKSVIQDGWPEGKELLSPEIGS